MRLLTISSPKIYVTGQRPAPVEIMTPMKINSFIVALCLLLGSCSDDTKDYLTAFWVVEEILIENVSIKNRLFSNGLYFKDSGKCFMPTYNIDQNDQYNWRIEKKNDNIEYLLIESENAPFSGRYELNMYKTENGKRLNIELTSEKIFIKASTLTSLAKKPLF